MWISRDRAGRTLNRWAWALIAILAIPATIRADEAQAPTKFDCGVNALFILLQLEGRPVDLDRVESALPRRHPDGYSMEELLAAGRSMGLSLEGVRFAKGDAALDRPAIAFVKDARGGHFTVLRPVGTTGTMVQVIDPPHVPWITDYDRLFESRTWTGRILIPRDPWHVRYSVPLALAGLGIPLVSLSVWRHRRSSRPSPSDAPQTD